MRAKVRTTQPCPTPNVVQRIRLVASQHVITLSVAFARRFPMFLQTG